METTQRGDGDETAPKSVTSTANEFIYVAHPEGRRTSVKLRAMTEALLNAIRTPPYWDGWKDAKSGRRVIAYPKKNEDPTIQVGVESFHHDSDLIVIFCNLSDVIDSQTMLDRTVQLPTVYLVCQSMIGR